MAFLTEHGLETLLTDLKDVFARIVHTHDDRYYTETETDTLLDGVDFGFYLDEIGYLCQGITSDANNNNNNNNNQE